MDGGGASGLRERRGRSDRVLGRLLAVETQGLRLVFGAALAGVVYDAAVVQARGQAQRREGLTMVGYDEVVEELRALRGRVATLEVVETRGPRLGSRLACR